MQEAFFGVRRFDDFQRNLSIARNTLTDRLNLLIECDLLHKRAYQTTPRRYEYRLTDRGLDTYPYALSLMKWGDEWLADAGGPPVRLRHKTCNKALRALAICGACEREVRSEDVSINPASAKGSESQDGTQVRYSSRPALYTAGRATSISRALAVIGDRWGFFVLWLAFAGITKFDHFHRILGIARTTLTKRLERMIEQGLLDRIMYRERPPRHDYHLTPKGQALAPVLLTLFDWGQRGLRTQPAHAHVLHKSCGEPLRISVVCEHCREVVSPRDVVVAPENGEGRDIGRQKMARKPPAPVELPEPRKPDRRPKVQPPVK